MSKRPWSFLCTTHVWLSVGHTHSDHLKYLEAFRDECTLPSYNAWTNMARVEFHLLNIKRDLLPLLVEFLNLPFVKDPNGARSNNDQGFRWIQMEMCKTKFAVDNTAYGVKKQDYCTSNDIHAFLSAVANRSVSLDLGHSPQMVSSFLSTPCIEHFAMDKFKISQSESLSPGEFARLGNIIRSSVQLRELQFHIFFGDGAGQFLDGLKHAVNLEKLYLSHAYFDDERRRKANLQLGDSGPWIQLLQNPQNQLKELTLYYLGLDDQHLIAISRVLPMSQIVTLTFEDTCRVEEGVLEFARQLPRIQSLETVAVHPVESPLRRSEISAALLQGVMENTSLYQIYIDCDEPLTVHPLFWYYLTLNRAGRRLLTSSQPVPDGLWPHVLERVWKMRRLSCGPYVPTPMTSSHDVVYFFFQNCPRIWNMVILPPK